MRRTLLTIATPLVAFAVALGAFAALSGPGEAGSSAQTATPQLSASATPDERIRVLEELAEAKSGGSGVLTQLGEAYLQKAREIADPGFYDRAQAVFDRARRLSPEDPDASLGLGTLALARHDFTSALDFGRQARRLAPGTPRPYSIITDALVELGRFDEAGQALQRMIDLKPNLASYSRVSYFRELHGDLDGAVEAMRLAVSAGGATPESVAYVQTLLGDLERSRGQDRAASRAYATALTRLPRYVPAMVGQARLDAARGRSRRAIAGLTRVTQRLPLPEYVIELGETQLASGDRPSARESFALVRAQRRLLTEAGVNTDVEFALFEADHGDAGRAVELARRAWAAAPGVRSADALGWALARAGRPAQGLRYARRALALGSRDALFLVHAGLTARDAGEPVLARRWLRRALTDNPRFSALWAPRARRALRALSA